MSKQFEETEYKTLTRNVGFFKRTQKLYNTILDGDHSEMIAEPLNIVKEIIDFIGDLVISEASREDVKGMERELHIAYLVVIRTIVLQTTDEKSGNKNDRGCDLVLVANYTASKDFRNWIEEYDGRKAILAAYSLLLDAKRDHPPVRRAFQEVNDYLREFFDNDGGHASRKYMREEKLVQAVHKLLMVCIDNTEDENNREETLTEFGFDHLYQCLCKDVVKWSVKHMKMRNFFEMFRWYKREGY